MSESRSLRTGKDAREVAGIRRFLDHLVHRVLHAETRVELAANDRKGPIGVVGQVFQFVVGLSSLDALCHFRRNSPARQRSQYVSESGDGARVEMQRYAPSLKRVVLEHFENRHENVGPLSQNSKRFFRTTSEHSVDAARTEAVDEVLSEAERHQLGNGQAFALRNRRE